MTNCFYPNSKLCMDNSNYKICYEEDKKFKQNSIFIFGELLPDLHLSGAAMTSVSDDAVVACSDLFEGLHVGDENLVAVCGDSDDDDDDDENNEPPSAAVVSNTSWRIERISKGIISNDQSTRCQSLIILKNEIDALLVNCPIPPPLNFPQPYSNSKPTLLEGGILGPKEKSRDVGESQVRLQAIFNSCDHSLFRVISDGKSSEKCRSLAINCLQSLLLTVGSNIGRQIPYLIPALRSRLAQCTYDKDMEIFVQDLQLHEFYKRGGATNRQDRDFPSTTSLIEPNEDIRLELCKLFECLVRGMIEAGAERILDAYYSDIIISIQPYLQDAYPDLRVEACNLLAQLLRIPQWEHGSKYFAMGLARSALLGCRQRNVNVVIASIGLFESSVCVPDRARRKGAGSAAIADLVGYREENVIPISAFYDSKCSVSINTLAELASHKNHRVRLRCCEMLSFMMIYLPDRYDHQQRLLPYVLSFIVDDMSAIRQAALDCMEKCGLQYERDNPDDIIERRQFGIDGDEDIDYDDISLPESFTRGRPNLGARLFVRANAGRFFLALLGELSSWREQTRCRAAELLLVLTVYCEEHLTKDFHHTLTSIANAIGVELSSSQSTACSQNNQVLETMKRALRLMAKYVDPSAYLPLLLPRISGDSTSATSCSEDGCHSDSARRNNLIILTCLIEGAPLHRLLLHWIDLVTLLLSDTCIGPFVGTQTRRLYLTALLTLTNKITTNKEVCTTTETENSVVSYFTDSQEVGRLEVLVTLINAKLNEMRESKTSNDDDLDDDLVQQCIDGLSKVVSVIF